MSSLQSKPIKIVMISPFTSVCGSAIRFWNMAIELARHDFNVVYADRKSKNSNPYLLQMGKRITPAPRVQFHAG
jgi:hypothetical protein